MRATAGTGAKTYAFSTPYKNLPLKEQSRGVTFETDTFAKLMGERNGLRVGLQVGREQWNPATIATILTVGQ